jgi:hypothetical protein
MAPAHARKIMFDDIAEAVPNHATKERQCLSCSGTFRSQWAGERICKLCKQTSAWRAGVAPQSTSAR